MSFEHILSELRMTKPTDCSRQADAFIIEMRLKSITKRQIESTSMFNRLQAIIAQIEENFKPKVKDSKFIGDENYSSSHTSSDASSSSSTSSPPPVSEQRFIRTQSAKRKIIDDEYQEFSAEDVDTASPSRRHSSENTGEQYPQQVGDEVILGPNGTQVDLRSYSSIIWSSSAAATRQLLAFVFSSDVLATHTLTGKPSPAFYGRERPPKMQLDPIKAADIIHCVKSKFQCSEREIRAAITTKCSDTSKKYKRRSQKQIESTNKM